jgi:hypothetical protein
MRIACPTDLDDDTQCGWGNGLDVSIIDGTKYQATMQGDTFAMSIDCDYNSKAAKMTCVADLNDTKTTGVLSGTDLAFATASVVEGADLLTASATPTPSASSSASAGASQAPKTSAAAAAASTGLKTSASASASLPESTGAAARFGIEGSALLVLAGAAALNVW